MSSFKVVKLDKKTCAEFCSKKHYSRKIGIFWEGFGLVENGKIVGVAVYGQPSAALQKHAFDSRDFRFYELSRLVVQTRTKNACSFLIGNSLKMLEKPCAVVSYSDTSHGHSGIVYQSTNWAYTGATVSHDKLYEYQGTIYHPMTLRDMGITAPIAWAKEVGARVIKPKEKHRYFYFCGSRTQVRHMKDKLKYNQVLGYPKSDKTMYDDGPEVHIDYQQH